MGEDGFKKIETMPMKDKSVKLFGYIQRLKFEAVRGAIGRSFIASNISIRRIKVY